MLLKEDLTQINQSMAQLREGLQDKLTERLDKNQAMMLGSMQKQFTESSVRRGAPLSLEKGLENADDRFCEGFRTTAHCNSAGRHRAVVRKGPGKEPEGR